MQPQEIEVLERHTQALNALADALRSKEVDVPDDKRLWTAQMCADYLGIKSARSFIEHTASLPDFPDAVPIPSVRSSSSTTQRRWVAKEVMDWALSNRDKVQARRKSRK